MGFSMHDSIKAKLEGVLQSSLDNNSSSTSVLPPVIRLSNGDKSCVVDAEKLGFIQDPALTQLLKSRRRFGPPSRYSIAGSPELFDKFIEWINERPQPLKYCLGRYSASFWIDNAAPAWFLACRIQAHEFEKYALSQFIQNCSLCAFGPWQKIQEEAAMGSSLRRFSNHWIAWNHHLSGRGESEFSRYSAASLASQVSDKTRDPRIYDLEHWYDVCGEEINPGPQCHHDPIQRNEKRLMKKRRKEKLKSVNADEWQRNSELTLKEWRQHQKPS